jgi:hypothetical protein
MLVDLIECRGEGMSDTDRTIWVTIEDRANILWNLASGPSNRMHRAADPLDLREKTIVAFDRLLARGTIENPRDMQLLGTLLYTHLFDEEFSKAFGRELELVRKEPHSMLRLVLVFKKDAREFAEMPWEYLFYPERNMFLATDTKLILARQVDVDARPQVARSPLRILIVVSEPNDQKQVAATPIIEEIEKLAERSPKPIRVERLMLHPTKRDLAERIERFQPHVLHFIGHGQYRRIGDDRNAEWVGQVALVDERRPGKVAQWTTDRDLANCFAAYPPTLVFLHACEGARTESYEAFRGVALQLVLASVPAVVAMRYEVENDVANRFAVKFYESLAEGKRIDRAVQDGRRELGMYLEDQDFSSRAFGSPVAFLTNGLITIIGTQDDGPAKPTRITCPNGKCQQVIELDDKFCGNCNEQLEPCPVPKCPKGIKLKGKPCTKHDRAVSAAPGPTGQPNAASGFGAA